MYNDSKIFHIYDKERKLSYVGDTYVFKKSYYILWIIHCVKSVRIRSYSGPHFPAFGLSTERYSVSLRVQSECGKMGTRISPNTDTFYPVI